MTEIAELQAVVDFPKYVLGGGGTPSLVKPKRPNMRETDWTAALMAKVERWAHLVELKPIVSVDLEYVLTFADVDGSSRSLGLPRVDAVCWHADNECSLFEMKLETSPGEVMGGIGQLLYYKAHMERTRQVKVDALVLVAPFLPMLALEAIADVKADIRFLKATTEMWSGLVPHY